jgi:hypothetical protein
MTRLLFVGPHAAAAAALCVRAGRDAAFSGQAPPDAVVEALEEAGVSPAARADHAPTDVVVDTGEWGLPEPVGLCLEEARELRDVIDARVAGTL